MRAKAQGPSDRVEVHPPGLDYDVFQQQQGYGQPVSQRKDSREDDRDRHSSPMAPSKSSPAATAQGMRPVQDAAGTTVGPPPVKLLKMIKKLPEENVAVEPPTIEEPPSGSVSAAAAALEKLKEKKRRISTMMEVQIMEKLRSVVSPDDPKVLNSKIEKIGLMFASSLVSSCCGN